MLLIPRRLSTSRRFPHLSWAWPGGCRELLVIAAAHADERRAAEAFVEWLSTTDIESCHFPEQRMLVRIASRFPRVAPQGVGARTPQRHRAPAVDQGQTDARPRHAGAEGLASGRRRLLVLKAWR
jgi:hypothetical protein